MEGSTNLYRKPVDRKHFPRNTLTENLYAELPFDRSHFHRSTVCQKCILAENQLIDCLWKEQLFDEKTS